MFINNISCLYFSNVIFQSCEKYGNYRMGYFMFVYCYSMCECLLDVNLHGPVRRTVIHRYDHMTNLDE